MDPLWIALAFGFGLLVRQVGLPPLVGFLAAGFVLNALGAEAHESLKTVADMGVTLLLFTIGLKLKLGSLMRPQVWAVASIHMLTTVAVFGIGLYLIGVAGFSVLGTLDLKLSLLIAFALSFSSTVFAVKALEDKGEMQSLHGRIAIGILIVQDLVAVLFLVVSAGKTPSVWAVALFGLIPLRHFLIRIMHRSGHGELLILYGFLLALGGAYVFDLVGLKGDLGALIVGILLASDPKASELSKSLFGFKDLFLVGFFLSIGLSGTPSLQSVGIAVLLSLLVIVKVGLFFILFTRFKMRARSSMLASFTLANYSEFGLIVAALLVAQGSMGSEWLTVIAIAVSITFVVAAPLNKAGYAIYARFCDNLRCYETEQRLPDEELLDPGEAAVTVIGMGRVGSGAFDTIRDRLGDVVVGLDRDPAVVRRHLEAGRNVVLGDATDSDFWERAQPGKVQITMLAMPDHSANMYALERIKAVIPERVIVATAKHADEIDELRRAGADATFDFFSGAGAGLAERACEFVSVMRTAD
jgi:predicted Kef-type K+ transport protein